MKEGGRQNEKTKLVRDRCNTVRCCNARVDDAMQGTTEEKRGNGKFCINGSAPCALIRESTVKI